MEKLKFKKDEWLSKMLDVNSYQMVSIVDTLRDFPEDAKLIIYKDSLTNLKNLIFLQKFGFIVCGVSIELELDKEFESVEVNQKHKIREFKTQDLGRLKEIAGLSFIYTHFYQDQKIPTEKIKKIYEEWITNCTKGRSEKVFVITDESDLPLGFIACNIDKECNAGIIDLIAVNSEIRGKGLGYNLVKAAITWFKSCNLESIKVKTEAANIKSLRVYERAGFRIRESYLEMHYWKE